MVDDFINRILKELLILKLYKPLMETKSSEI
jgi:hypothetical protein